MEGMKGRILVTCVRNPFDPLAKGSREVRELDWQGRTVRELIADFYSPERLAGYDLVVSIDGALVDGEDLPDLVPAHGSSVVFCAAPRGGGNGNKNPLATIAMLAVIVVAAVTQQYYLASYGTTFTTAAGATAYTAGSLAASALVAAGVTVVGGMLVSALFPTSAQDPLGIGSGNFATSATYGWGVESNAINEGGAVPVIYGTHRIVPPLIGKSLEIEGDKQYLNLLFAVADHQVDSIADVRINDTPVVNFRDVQVETRLGTLDQPVIQYFNDTAYDAPVTAKLSTGWTTRTTAGNAVQGIGIGLSLPRGLYYANDQGGLDSQTVRVAIEYRKVGAASWTRMTGTNAVQYQTTGERWSAGYYEYSRWVEMEAGTTTPGDHTDGDPYTPANDTWRCPNCGDAHCRRRPVFEWRWLPGLTIYHAPGTVETPYEEISAAQSSPLRRTYFRDRLEAGQYEVRCALYETPPSGSRYGNDVYFDFLKEIVYDDFTYPGTALLAVRALATDQLSGGMPKVDCLATRSTVPVWTGAAYENLPAHNLAWMAYDVLHNGDYGSGVAASRLVYADFLAWAEWCTEKGYRGDIYFDSVVSVRKALDTVSLLGRASVVQMGSLFTCIVDRPEPLPCQRFLFTMGNIVKDSFAEEFLPMEDRANAVEVTYFDRDLDYSRQTVEIHAADFDTTTRGIRKSAVTLFGCTGRQQAINYGKFLLNCNRWLTITASWDADADALACLPGNVVEVSHDVPQWGYSGRIEAATATTVRLDRDVALAGGTSYGITVKHQDDDAREDRAVVGTIADPAWNAGDTYGIGDYVSEGGVSYVCIQEIAAAPAPSVGDGRYWRRTGTGLTVAAWTKIPAQHALYAVGELTRVTKAMRILRITRSQDLRRRVTAIEYVPQVYEDYAEIPPYTQVSDLDVSGLAGTERWVYSRDGSGQSIVDLTWRGVALAWDVYHREAGGAWNYDGKTIVPRFSVAGLIPGHTYEFTARIQGVAPSPTGQIWQYTPQGKALPPADVTGFAGQEQPDGTIAFTWDHVLDVDLWGYELRMGESWEKSTPVVDGVQENRSAYNPGMAGTYKFWIKAVDDSGNKSATAAGLSITTNVTSLNIVLQGDELTDSPPATGVFDRTVYAPTLGAISLIAGMTDTDEPAWTDEEPVIADYAGSGDLAGSYTSPAYDLGAKAVFSLRVQTAYESIIRSATDRTVASRSDRTYPLDTDLSISAAATQGVYYATSDDGMTYTGWQPIVGAVVCNARYFKIKVACAVETAATSFEWSSIARVADVEEKRVDLANRAIGTGGEAITLASLGLTILVDYVVGATVLGSASKWPVIDRQSDQFTVRLFDAGGAAAGNVDLQIRGY